MVIAPLDQWKRYGPVCVSACEGRTVGYYMDTPITIDISCASTPGKSGRAAVHCKGDP